MAFNELAAFIDTNNTVIVDIMYRYKRIASFTKSQNFFDNKLNISLQEYMQTKHIEHIERIGYQSIALHISYQAA